MEKPSLYLLLLVLSLQVSAQTGQDTSWKKVYRESDVRVNDVIHTKLEVKFDYDKAWLYGKAWVTFKPHFYPTDSLLLDAKQMAITKVSLSKGSSTLPLKYEYDGWDLKIKLDRVYKASEDYTIYIEYTAKPNEAKIPVGGYKGLYFINPKEKEQNKPVQIWTDGETEHTSFWCPTIDKPNQKSTEEIVMTVPNRFVTLSNGKLIDQKKNKDGTRTDHWKMDQPHAPYLFFMAIGDFAIIRDEYKGKEVNYYVEKEYASTAKKIFGLTPAMIAFYSKITGVPYPWVKYSQIVLRDFSSRAMENTTATAHSEFAQQDARELIDGNRWESNIAHELFHQWFGDYVTCESWSNLSLNEAFANYGQYLWKEYYYGSDAAGEEYYNNMYNYLNSPGDSENPLVRFYYDNKDDLSDAVNYNKGGCILHMLRNYVGDSAFFKAINLYLTTYKFKTAEAHQLRLAFEEVTGKDLNWFFNQWFFGKGHLKVTISYYYDDIEKKVTVKIKQTQSQNNVFKIPITIDIYSNSKKISHQVWINNPDEDFIFSYTSRPDLVNVDAGKFILWEKTDDKTLQNFIYQYRYGGSYIDRREAIVECLKQQENPIAMGLLKITLKDKYPGLRNFILEELGRRWDRKSDSIKQSIEPILIDLAKNDKTSSVKAKAIGLLSRYQKNEYRNLFIANVNDSSYSVAGAALAALSRLDSVVAFEEAKRQMNLRTRGALTIAIITTIMKFGSEEQSDFISSQYVALPFTTDKLRITGDFINYLTRVQSTEVLKKAVDMITGFLNLWDERFKVAFNEDLIKLAAKKESAGLGEQADYIKSRLPKQQ